MSGKGCLIWGCSVTAGIALIIAMIIGFGAYNFYQQGKSFTSEKPMKIEVYEPSEEEYQTAMAKANEFRNAIKHNKQVKLEFTSEDINSLIARHKKLTFIKDNVTVKFEGNEVMAEGSIPLKEFLPIYKDRYLNGSFVLNASMKNGRLHVTAQNVIVDGKPLPSGFMTQLRNENLARDAYNNPENAEFLAKLKNLEIKDGKLIIETK